MTYPEIRRDPKTNESDTGTPDIDALRDPNIGWIPKEKLPFKNHFYTFTIDFLPFIKDNTRLELYLEGLMGSKLQPYCRRLRQDVINALHQEFSDAVRISGGIHVKYWHGMPEPSLREMALQFSKFQEKEAKKVNSTKFFVGSVPFVAGPNQIREKINEYLEDADGVQALDAKWKTGIDDWKHDGAVFLFVKPEHKETLENAKGKITMLWKTTSGMVEKPLTFTISVGDWESKSPTVIKQKDEW